MHDLVPFDSSRLGALLYMPAVPTPHCRSGAVVRLCRYAMSHSAFHFASAIAALAGCIN